MAALAETRGIMGSIVRLAAATDRGGDQTSNLLRASIFQILLRPFEGKQRPPVQTDEAKPGTDNFPKGNQFAGDRKVGRLLPKHVDGVDEIGAGCRFYFCRLYSGCCQWDGNGGLSLKQTNERVRRDHRREEFA